MAKYTEPTFYFDFQDPDIQDFVKRITSVNQTQKEKALSIYYAVRDNWKYNPYHVSKEAKAYKASQIFNRDAGHCIDKTILMIAACRAVGIPARICLAKVRNHIATEKLVEKLGTDELLPHGYAEIYLEGKWIKSTPVFNKSLCYYLNVTPLEFDGKNDSIFQEFDKEGGSFMEYLEEYGNFEDVPLDFMHRLMKSHYPHFF